MITKHLSILLFILSISSYCSAQDNTTPYKNKNVSILCSRCSCLTAQNLYSADCDDSGYKEIPDFRQDLDTLWSLRLVGNRIEEVSKFPPMSNLTSIVLKFNYIWKIVNDAFSELPGLDQLDLSHNNITWQTFDGNAFRGKYQSDAPMPLPVTHLNVSHNNIKKLPEHAFEHLSRVVCLDISHNPFHDFSQNTANAFTELVSLEILNLAYTHLSRLPNHFFAELTNLKELDLSGNSFVAVPNELHYARYLQTLKLDDNIFGTLEANSFGPGLSELRALYLRGSQTLFNIEAGTFSNLTNLEILYLSHNAQLEFIWNGAFDAPVGQRMQLKELHLNDNQLYVVTEELLNWYDIPLVDIQNNPWHCDCDFEWVARGLVPRMTERNREVTKNVKCASPARLSGHIVSDDTVQRDSFKCQPRENSENTPNPSSMLVIAVIVVGAIILITGLLILSYSLLRRSKTRDWFSDNVKYRRTTNEEEDIIASTVQY